MSTLLYAHVRTMGSPVHDSAVAKNKIQHAGMRYALTSAAVLTSNTIQYSTVPL